MKAFSVSPPFGLVHRSRPCSVSSRFQRLPGVLSFLLIVGLALNAAADYGVESLRPLPDPNKPRLDHRVVGAWNARMQDKDYYLHVGTGNLVEKSDWMEVVLVNPGEKPLFYLHHKIGFTSAIGGRNYMNVANLSVLVSQLRGSSPKDLMAQAERFDILKYEVGDGYIDVWPADQKFIREAIKTGKIKGSNATIDDTPTNLLRFLNESDAKIFAFKIRYFRVKPSAEQPKKAPKQK